MCCMFQAVVDAGLAAGLRHFDSASFYNNEARLVQWKILLVPAEAMQRVLRALLDRSSHGFHRSRWSVARH